MAPHLEFPPSLTSRQRAVLHELAEGAGIPHRSIGDTGSRVLRLGADDAELVRVTRAAEHASPSQAPRRPGPPVHQWELPCASKMANHNPSTIYEEIRSFRRHFALYPPVGSTVSGWLAVSPLAVCPVLSCVLSPLLPRGGTAGAVACRRR